MRVGLLLLAFVLAPETEWRAARPDYDWSFPRDHWAHPGFRTEWWYFTGHLGDRFAYQFTLFRIGVLRDRPELDSSWASPGFVLGHAALTDLETNEHRFAEVLYRQMPLLAGFGEFPDPRIGWSRAPAGTEGLWSLDWNGDGFDFAASDERLRFGFRLVTRPEKRLVLQGPNGFSRKGRDAAAASEYVSYTRLRTSGEVTLDGKRFDVRGESWMDQEFSSQQLGPQQVGWDWFSLRLDSGRELMLYLMRAEDGSLDFARGTLVGLDGSPIYLESSDFSVEVLDRWTSPTTGASYPSKWRIRIEELDLDLELAALVADQENRSLLPGGVYYWEGAVSVRHPSGASAGRGFVEMTGYGDGNRPPV